MRSVIMSCGLIGGILLIGAFGSAQQPDTKPAESPLYLPPKTPEEHWKAIQFEVNTGGYELAARYLASFLELGPNRAGPSKEELLKLEKKYGLQSFLKLKTIPKWSADAEVDKAAKADVLTVVASMTEAIKQSRQDPKRITYFAERLIGEPEERDYAQVELIESGPDAVPTLVALLIARPVLRDPILDLIPKLQATTIPAFLAVLDAPDNRLRLDILTALRRRRDLNERPATLDTDPRPFLWYLADAKNQQTGLRELATEMLQELREANVARRNPVTELTRFAELVYSHQAKFSEPYVLWRWQGTELTQSPSDLFSMERFFGLRAARLALELNTEDERAKVIFLSLAIDAALTDRDPMKPVGNYILAARDPGLYQLVVSAPLSLLSEVLSRALSEQRSMTAFAVIQALNARVERSPGVPPPHTTNDPTLPRKTAILERALNYKFDPRVRLAAAIALLNIPGPPQHNSTERIIDVLREAITSEAGSIAANGRVILADGRPTHAEALASRIRRAGFEVVEVLNGKDIFRAITASSDVNAIYIDERIAFPTINELLAQLKADVRVGHLPIFVVVPNPDDRSVGIDSIIVRLAFLIGLTDEDESPEFQDIPDPAALTAYTQLVNATIKRRTARLAGIIASNGQTFRPVDLSGETLLRLESLSMAVFELLGKTFPQKQFEANRRVRKLTELPLPESVAAVLRLRRNALQEATRPFFAEEQKMLAELTRVVGQSQNRLRPDQQTRFQIGYREFMEQNPAFSQEILAAAGTLLSSKYLALARTAFNVKVIPEPFTEDAVNVTFQEAKRDIRFVPLAAEEKKGRMLQAMLALRSIAFGELPGFSPTLAAKLDAEVRALTANEEAAPIAIDIMSRLPSKEAQQDLVNLVLAPARKPEIRRQAGEAAVIHIQRFGRLLTPAQQASLKQLLDAKRDPEILGQIAAIVGVAPPADLPAIGQRLQGYVPPEGGMEPAAPKKDEGMN